MFSTVAPASGEAGSSSAPTPAPLASLTIPVSGPSVRSSVPLSPVSGESSVTASAHDDGALASAAVARLVVENDAGVAKPSGHRFDGMQALIAGSNVPRKKATALPIVSPR